MGQIWTRCCDPSEDGPKKQYAYTKVQHHAGLLEDLKSKPSTSDSKDTFNFLQLQKKLLASPYISHAAIINFTDGNVLAANFECDREGIRDLVRAFKARPQFIREDGIRLSKAIPVYSLQDMERDVQVHGIPEADTLPSTSQKYGSTVINRGVSARRTLSSIVVVTYEGNADLAKTFLKQTVNDLIDEGH